MPEARDRLVRLHDESESNTNPLGKAATAAATPRVQMTFTGRGGGGSETPRSGVARGRNAFGSTPVTRGAMGRENNSVGSSQRGRSVLPSWYPRTPLKDITAIVKALERRRAHMGEVEVLQTKSPMFHSLRVNNSSVPLSSDPLIHDIYKTTPIPNLSVGKVPKILHDISNQAGAELESLTPQKKLLDSIDIVEKLVMEELNKLKRTPTAKKAKREKAVCILMSLR